MFGFCKSKLIGTICLDFLEKTAAEGEERRSQSVVNYLALCAVTSRPDS